MSRYLPSWKGFAAVLVSFFATMFIPALLPAKNGHTGKFMAPVSAELWAITAITIVASLALAVFAFRRGTRPDRVAGVLAALLAAALVAILLHEAA
jgi:predicted permease